MASSLRISSSIEATIFMIYLTILSDSIILEWEEELLSEI